MKYLLPASIVSVYAALLALSAGAQIIECPGARVPGQQKILLDDITVSGTPSDPVEAQLLMAQIRAAVHMKVEQFRAQSPVPITVVRCEGRRPSGEDFDSDLVRSLNSHDVLVETWASVTTTADVSGAAGVRGLLGFAVIPVRQDRAVVGVHLILFRRSAAATEEAMLELFGQSRELQAFTALAVGVKARRSREYERALRQVCEAQDLLASLAAGQSDLAGLQAYARDAITGIVQEARQATPTNLIQLWTPEEAARPCQTVKGAP